MILDGGEIYLRLPSEKDLEGNWYKWLNDPVVTKLQNKGIFVNSRELQRKYYHKMMESKNDVLLAIIDKETETHIGCVGLHHIDSVHRSAELGIVIGEKEFWGKGYGRKTWNLITHYGLFILNLHRIYVNIMCGNNPSIRSAKASGYVVEGTIQDMYYKNGEYHHALILSVFKKGFKKVEK